MKISDGLARRLLDATPDPGIVIDADGQVLYANARVREVFGYEPAEMVGQHMEMLLPERFREVHPQHREAYFRNPAPRPMGSGLDLYARHRDGTEMPVEISLNPVDGPDGLLVFAALRDVTAQKDLQRQLEEASRAKSRFLAAASHDLRQPIQALTILNSVARKSTTDVMHQSIIEKQQKSLDSMASLLNALLDISKLEAGIVKPDITDCEVQNIFDDLRAGFEVQAEDKGLQLIIEPCGDIARSDSRLLKQILENFMSNAIRYTQEGFIRVRCRHRNPLIELEVADTGLGIAPEEIGHIFEEFHQAEAGTARPEGLGLGLSIVKRTAELLGCDLRVESKPGEGSAFSVIVPQGSRGGARREDAGRAEPLARVTGNILLVDDEPAVLDATALLLELEGFTVLTATCVTEALQCAASRTPDLLITDYHLRSGETGADVIRSVRGRVGAALPVVLISGDTSDAIVLQDLSATSFLTKPVDTDELMRLICRGIQAKG